MRISDWSSDVCSSDPRRPAPNGCRGPAEAKPMSCPNIPLRYCKQASEPSFRSEQIVAAGVEAIIGNGIADRQQFPLRIKEKRELHRNRHLARRAGERVQSTLQDVGHIGDLSRSEEHTSELQSLLRISYAVSCLTKKILNSPLISELIHVT